MTPEQQERIRLNRERALAKRKAAQEKQAEQNDTQTGTKGFESKKQSVCAVSLGTVKLRLPYLMRSDNLNDLPF